MMRCRARSRNRGARALRFTALRPAVLLLVLSAFFAASSAFAQPFTPVFADGRDRLTLLDQHLVNHSLFEQLAAPGQSGRLGRELGPLAVAADALTGAQAAGLGEQQTRFHGFYLLDAFVAVRPLDGLDANLNLVALNPSASDGYRASAELHAGLALHAYGTILQPWGEAVYGDVLAFDLGPQTIGRGLLLEGIRVEGYAAGLRFRDAYLRALVAGRVFWPDDNLSTYVLGLFGGAIELLFTAWHVDRPGEAATMAPYAGVALRHTLFDLFHVAAEYEAHLGQAPVRHGALVRADFIAPDLPWLALHAGYQLRFYQQGFGPSERLSNPTSIYNTPILEDQYATNSFEYFGISPFYDQLSHTGMLEARVPIAFGLRGFLECEYWLRAVRDTEAEPRPLFLPSGERVPAVLHDFFYRAGLEWLPWQGLPHRARLLYGNKFVASGASATDPQTSRFIERPLVLIEGEVFL